MKNFYALIVTLFMVNGAMAQWFYPNPNDTAYYHGAVYFTDANAGYVSKNVIDWIPMSPDTIWKTTDGGMNWFPQYGSEQAIVAIFFPDANTGYAIERLGGPYSGFHWKILKTTNGGSNWIPTTFDTGWGLESIFFTDANTGYAAGGEEPSNNFIIKTTDGGINWVTQLNATGDFLYSIFFIDTNTGYAVGANYSWPMHRTVLKTTDGGLNWVPVLDEQGFALSSVFFTSADTGYVAGYNDLLKTTDGGLNWINLTYGTNSMTFGNQSLFFTDANTGYAVGEDYFSGPLIIKTTDGGTNWFVQSINGQSNYSGLYSVFFPVADTGYITNYRGILKTENGGGFPVGIDEQNNKKNILSIYPNPTSTNITIETTAKGNISICNISGQQLLQLKITELSTNVDITKLSKGVYLVRVVGEKNAIVGKFVKQ